VSVGVEVEAEVVLPSSANRQVESSGKQWRLRPCYVLPYSTNFCQILPNSANRVGGMWWNMMEYGGGYGGGDGWVLGSGSSTVPFLPLKRFLASSLRPSQLSS
jgi:hypothetical protein